MTNQPPASGERASLRGYQWQYDHIAAIVYDALLAGEFLSLRLTDDTAGRVDDLVLVREGRVDAYQFRTREYPGALTFGRLTRKQPGSNEASRSSIVEDMADGWSKMRHQADVVNVHFVTNQRPSVSDSLSEGNGRGRLSPDHFSAFLSQVLEPLRAGTIALDNLDSRWKPALTRFLDASCLPENDQWDFLRSLHFDLGTGSAMPRLPSTRRSDVAALSAALLRRVSGASDLVELDEQGVLRLVGWQGRPSLRNYHNFPIDLDTYKPLRDAQRHLRELVSEYDRGYVGVIGPPGTGKSTLLAQTLTGTNDYIVRYYAYVPKTSAQRTRLTAGAFLHDVVVMLRKGGLQGAEPALPSDDLLDLRRQFADLLDSAGGRYIRTQRRTVIVVDGLDHVNRDYKGHDDLISELPNPEELPDGVLVVVGSRMLDFPNFPARQHLDDRRATIDLRNHPLTPASVLEICRRAPFTAMLSREMHQQIVGLSEGNPLALNYILNRLRDLGDDSPENVLAKLPPYAGDIGALYTSIWSEVESNPDVTEILTVCSRLRIGFTTEWLLTWAKESAVRTFQRGLAHLFRSDNETWRFFHDSFRQFAAAQTALDDPTFGPESAEAFAHRKVADYCSGADLVDVAAEELYHRYRSGEHENVLLLANQRNFREQYRQLRSPDLIRQDISLALDVAADRADVLGMLRSVLALVELTERNAMLDEIDLPALLYKVGLVREAIAFSDVEALRIPLAQAYGLTADLGRDGDPEGRRLFDLIAHHGLDEPDTIRGSSDSHDTATAWIRAGVWFRPMQDLIRSINRVMDSPPEEENEQRRMMSWRMYELMFQSLIDEARVKGENSGFEAIEAALLDRAVQLIETTQNRQEQPNEHEARFRSSQVADVMALLVRSHQAVLSLRTPIEDAHIRMDRLLSTLRGRPLYETTVLTVAELLYRCEMVDKAKTMLDRTTYAGPLSASDMDSTNEDIVHSRFRYWHLCYILDQTAPPPAMSTVSHESLDSGTRESIQNRFAARLDYAIRTVAWLSARSLGERTLPTHEVWGSLAPHLDMFRPSTNLSLLGWGITTHKRALMNLIADMAARNGREMSQRLSDALSVRFQALPRLWLWPARLEMASRLLSCGANVSWYEGTVKALEDSLANEDVYSRLQDVEELARHLVDVGDLGRAQRLANSLIKMAFGVGWREDLQFEAWIEFLGRALRHPAAADDDLVDEATWLARVFTAVATESREAVGAAADNLPAIMVPVDPLSAVRVFEYLVRNGAVRHTDALAALVAALIEHPEAGKLPMLELAASITGEMIAPAATKAYPKLASSLVKTARHSLGRFEAKRLAESIAARTDNFALSNTRETWREALGLPPVGAGDTATSLQSNSDNYGALELEDGSRIPRSEVASRVQAVEHIIAFRRQESTASSFSWAHLIRKHRLTKEEIAALQGEFGDGSSRSLEVLVVLAEAAERNGDQGLALDLASRVRLNAPDGGWFDTYGGSKRRAAAVAIRSGGQKARLRACRDLANDVTSVGWLPSAVVSLPAVMETLAPDLDAVEVWKAVRSHLDGIAETLTLPTQDVLADHGCRWWLPEGSQDKRGVSENCKALTALAEVLVGHLSHPTWLMRDAATANVIRCLDGANEEVARALARFAQPRSSDDTLERAGRCLAAARSRDGYVPHPSLDSLERTLATHPSQVIRDLAASSPPKVTRPLSPAYSLAFPPQLVSPIDPEVGLLYPYNPQYKLLARLSNVNLDTLQRVATRYASEEISLLPDEQAVRNALSSAHMRHFYPSPFDIMTAARVAFGRVLADLIDADLLGNLTIDVRRMLRTVDIDLLRLVPQERPKVLPSPPKVDLDLTISTWCRDINSRIERYVEASMTNDCVLVGGQSRLAALKRGQPTEHFECGVTIGSSDVEEEPPFMNLLSLTLSDLAMSSPDRQTQVGEPLILHNLGHTFDQLRASWVTFRPDIAKALGWTPNVSLPGSWNTSSGELAAETVWWVDGWWGHGAISSFTTGAEGCAVLLTKPGLSDLQGTFGSTTCHFRLTRHGYEDGKPANFVSVSRSEQVSFQNHY